MKVSIKSCLDGAKEAKGIAVVIDVFRASNTIIACMSQNAKYILPVGSLEDAIKLKKQSSDHILFGERKGIIAKECDYGNSPFEASNLHLKNKKIIITTSAGSQGIVNATKADEILIGSFANAQAIINYIQEKNPQQVSLIAIGFESYEKAKEDELCAKYIKDKLSGKKPDFEKIKEKILECDGANRLRSLKQQDDLDFCSKLDIYNVVPKYNKESGRIIKN
jgi:2-phosphosulfolactate phosphatase